MLNIETIKDNAVLTADLNKRKERLSAIAKQDKRWKLYMALSYALFLCAVVILVWIAVMLFLHPTEPLGVIVFSFAGLMVACVPFFVGLSLRNEAMYECALPYSSYANGTLYLKEDELAYEYWPVGPNEQAAYGSPKAVFCDEDKYVYKVRKQDIINMTVDEFGVCSVKAKAVLEHTDWDKLEKAGESEEISVPKTQEVVRDFSFVVAFIEHDADETLNKWMNDIK